MCMQELVVEKNYGKSRRRIDFIFLCYTFMMKMVPSEWDNWAQILQQNHLTGLFSFLLTTGSPLKILFAQFFYLADPFFPGKRIQAFGKMLESPSNSENFLNFLRDINKNE